MNQLTELQIRIKQGEENVNHLTDLVNKLTRGSRRDALESKAIQMLLQLENLKQGFIEFYPDDCLYVGKKCQSANKGTYVCKDCLLKQGVLL